MIVLSSFKRKWAIVVVAVVAVWGSGTAVASDAGAPEEGFSDVGRVHAYGIERVAELGIDSGCGNGRFCPADPISRAEMAAWLYRAAALLYGPPPPDDEAQPDFSDVPDSAWYGPYARWAAANGVIAADGGTFNPEGAVTRAEAAVMLTAAFRHLTATDDIQGVFADIGDTTETQARAIEGIHAAGLTKGYATEPPRYYPHQAITRAQTATMLARAIQRAEPTVGLIVNEPQAARGYTLINSYGTEAVYLIDHLGRKVHTWEMEEYSVKQAKLLENGNLMIRHQRKGQGYDRVTEVDRDGDFVWEYPIDNVHHDFLKLPNGNVMLLLRSQVTSAEAVALGARGLNPLAGRKYFNHYIQEIKPTGPNSGEVVWEWHVLDHLVQDNDPDKPNYGSIAGNPGRLDLNYNLHLRPLTRNWSGLNTIAYNPVLDQIMLSSKGYGELWIIDHNTTTEEAAGPKGDLLYRWGNPQAYGAGGYEDQRLFRAHDNHWIPPGLPGEGNVLIFNNGDEYPERLRNYSSVDEISLPPFEDNAYPRDERYTFASSQLQWTHTAPNPTDFYIPRMSGAQRLPNGNTQICTSRGTVFQVTPNGKTVWKYINPLQRGARGPVYQGTNIQNTTYRAPWYPPDYVGLKDMDLTPKGPVELYR